MTLPRLLPIKRKAKVERLQRQNRPRSKAHLNWVAKHCCCVPDCPGMPIEAAHVRTGTGGGVGLKPGDQWTISLCQGCHGWQHGVGEDYFQDRTGIDMRELAIEFAQRSPVRAICDAAGKTG